MSMFRKCVAVAIATGYVILFLTYLSIKTNVHFSFMSMLYKLYDIVRLIFGSIWNQWMAPLGDLPPILVSIYMTAAYILFYSALFGLMGMGVSMVLSILNTGRSPGGKS